MDQGKGKAREAIKEPGTTGCVYICISREIVSFDGRWGQASNPRKTFIERQQTLQLAMVLR